MSERLRTYEQWFIAQPPGRAYPRTLDEVEVLAAQVHAGSENESAAETLAVVTEWLLAELRSHRAADAQRLTAEEREALEWLRSKLNEVDWCWSRSIEAFDRLLNGGAP